MAKNKINPTKGPWKKNEDELLKQFVIQFGPKNWSFIANKMNDHNIFRLGKQCRERWFNHLSPEVRKDPWTEEEDKIIIEEYNKMGSKWTLISNLLVGRTPNSIKNRWNSTLKRTLSNGTSKKRKAKPYDFVIPSKKMRKYDDLEDSSHGLSLMNLNDSDSKIINELKLEYAYQDPCPSNLNLELLNLSNFSNMSNLPNISNMSKDMMSIDNVDNLYAYNQLEYVDPTTEHPMSQFEWNPYLMACYYQPQIPNDLKYWDDKIYQPEMCIPFECHQPRTIEMINWGE